VIRNRFMRLFRDKVSWIISRSFFTGISWRAITKTTAVRNLSDRNGPQIDVHWTSDTFCGLRRACRRCLPTVWGQTAAAGPGWGCTTNKNYQKLPCILSTVTPESFCREFRSWRGLFRWPARVSRGSPEGEQACIDHRMLQLRARFDRRLEPRLGSSAAELKEGGCVPIPQPFQLRGIMAFS
jgi:hypothetical protein